MDTIKLCQILRDAYSDARESPINDSMTHAKANFLTFTYRGRAWRDIAPSDHSVQGGNYGRQR